jgi:acyl dehydratase
MYFDDMPVGFRYETGTKTVSREEIIDFARQWDPQPFHLDDEAAKASPYGRLIASGFHTLLVAFTLTLDASDWSGSSMGSPGMDNVRWMRPVYPGDTLQVRAEVVKATPSRSRGDRGYVDVDYEIVNQDGVAVASYRATHILRRAPEAS